MSKWLIAGLLIALSAGPVLAFPADNVPYCSGGFDKPARLVFKDSLATLTIGDKAKNYSPHEPLDGIDGAAYVEGDDGSTADDTMADIVAVKVGDEEAVLFLDRVFWPCDRQ